MKNREKHIRLKEQENYLKELIGSESAFFHEVKKSPYLGRGVKILLLSRACSECPAAFKATLDTVNAKIKTQEKKLNLQTTEETLRSRAIILFGLKLINDLCNNTQPSYALPADTTITYHFKRFGRVDKNYIQTSTKEIVKEHEQGLSNIDWNTLKLQRHKYLQEEKSISPDDSWRSKNMLAGEVMATTIPFAYQPREDFATTLEVAKTIGKSADSIRALSSLQQQSIAEKGNANTSPSM
ncbi:MAG: hypothetical protein EPN84_10420 [Legionella sp.]|nr:MAG: hypothetical protein EPN84_10420 [Legionella sp.]